MPAKIDTKHHKVKGIWISLNIVSYTSPRVKNSEIIKIYNLQILKSTTPKTAESIST